MSRSHESAFQARSRYPSINHLIGRYPRPSSRFLARHVALIRHVASIMIMVYPMARLIRNG